MVSGLPKRILVGTDGSRGAAFALRTAAGVSEETGSELYLVHVRRESPLWTSRVAPPATVIQAVTRPIAIRAGLTGPERKGFANEHLPD
jgi:nucleotide-binding universal stress UspA family protein